MIFQFVHLFVHAAQFRFRMDREENGGSGKEIHHKVPSVQLIHIQ